MPSWVGVIAVYCIELGTPKQSVTTARCTPKALGADSVPATVSVTQSAAIPLRGNGTSHLLRGKGWYQGHCLGAMWVWNLGTWQYLAHVDNPCR